MNTALHIWISRSIAVGLFAMVLILTPRAWVEPTSDTESVPVQTLEPANHDYCFWCEQPASSSCPDSNNSSERSSRETPKTKTKTNPRIWLNPDDPIRPVDLRPCPIEEDEVESIL